MDATLRREQPLDFVLKVASRCNLNCTYCYVYNKEDQLWRTQPPIMNVATFDAALRRIAEYCEGSDQRQVRIVFHGGEPTLVGTATFRDYCTRIRTALHRQDVRISVQTNATLIDDEWAGLFAEYAVDVGISLDGPADLNDRFRVYHSGAGSTAAVMRGVAALSRRGLPLHFLTVIQPGADSLRIHQALLAAGADTISYLFPDYNHDSVGSVTLAHGPTPCADFLLPIFEEEVVRSETEAAATHRVPLLRTLMKLVMGGQSDVDVFGNHPLSFIFINTDGAIEALDVLRVCAEGIASTGLNVHEHSFAHVASSSAFHRTVIFEGMPLCAACRRGA